jgi:hypothetical protein
MCKTKHAEEKTASTRGRVHKKPPNLTENSDESLK